MTIIIPTAPVLPPLAEAVLSLFFASDRRLKEQRSSFLSPTWFVSEQRKLPLSSKSISCIQELLRPKDNKTALIYTHMTNQALFTIKSPLDQLTIDHHLREKRKNDTKAMRI